MATFLDLATFKTWSEQALKTYLSLRDKSVEGDFDTLAARAFNAYEEDLPVNLEKEMEALQRSNEYRDRLIYGDLLLPDPFSLKDGWEKETDVTMMKWPSINIIDISNFLTPQSPVQLIDKLLCDYKEGKAYAYFKGEFGREILFNSISNKFPVCFLLCRVTPSMCIRNKVHSVWIAVKKDTNKRPGGEVVSSYCSCTAG